MRRETLICLLLIVATLAVFGQMRNHDFVDYDDPTYVIDNPQVMAGFTRSSIVWAFTTSHPGLWHPLTWLSLMLDFELYGLDPGGYHVTNLLLHLASTLLLFLVLKRATGGLWRSGFVAALFALHPLRVESVAWIAERKDVLSTFFWMLTMWGYVHYTQRPSAYKYLFTLLFFTLGLMAKPMLVTLPFVFLLLDYWPLDRLQSEKLHVAAPKKIASSMDSHRKRQSAFRLLWEKVPFFILAAVCSVLAFLAQLSAGSVESLHYLPVKIRLANSLVSYVGYIGKMIWPYPLAVFYPHPGHSLPIWQIVVSCLLLTGITVLVIWAALRQYRYFAVGWFWYLGTLVPVIGLVQVGSQAMADRYTYVPLIGLFIIIAWSIAELGKKIRYRRIILATVAVMLLSFLMTRTWLQLKHWKNSVALFGHAVAVTANNYVMHNSLGFALASQGKLEEAIGHYYEALRIRPSYVHPHNNLGNILLEQEKYDEAIAHYYEALRIKPEYAEAYNNLGIARARQQNLDEAVAHYYEALRIRPNYAEPHNNLGNILLEQEKYDEAIAHYYKALRFKPNYAEAHNNLGLALASQGKLEEAIGHYYEALRLKPEYVEAHNNLGHVLLQEGRHQEAIEHISRALEIEPDYANAHYNLGIALARQKNLDEAIAYYYEALRIKPEHAEAHNNLGAALADQGRLDEAITHYYEALRIKPEYAEAHNNLGVALDIQGSLQEAMAHFSEALRIKSEYFEAHNNLGVALAARGRFEEAIAHFSEALKINPNYAEAHNNLGLALARQGKLEEAIGQYSEALRIKPEYAEAHNNLGVALAAQGRLNEAIAHFSEALKINPNYAEAHNNLQLFLPIAEKEIGHK